MTSPRFGFGLQAAKLELLVLRMHFRNRLGYNPKLLDQSVVQHHKDHALVYQPCFPQQVPMSEEFATRVEFMAEALAAGLDRMVSILGRRA